MEWLRVERSRPEWWLFVYLAGCALGVGIGGAELATGFPLEWELFFIWPLYGFAAAWGVLAFRVRRNWRPVLLAIGMTPVLFCNVIGVIGTLVAFPYVWHVPVLVPMFYGLARCDGAAPRPVPTVSTRG